jgi:molybdopterin-guanine dinucleotide biosynthesis protein A
MSGSALGAPHAALTAQRFTALILAGSRAGGDPLARAAGVSHKALVPLAGRSMLARVVGTLRRVRAVHRIVLCGIDRAALATEVELCALLDSGRLELVAADATPSASVLAAMHALAPCTPLLVATADHPLLSPALVDDFCARSLSSGADVTVGLVDAQLVRAAFPTIRRTALPFRDGSYCGCNLYAFLTPAAQRAPAAWMQVERHRKRPWRLVSALGVGVTARFLLRRLTLEAVMHLASQRMRAQVRPIVLARPEAGFDIDTPAQLAAAEALVRGRDAASSAIDRG